MTLREQLRDEDPLLYDALLRSWRIAHETWLPAIPTSLGSHNAYPHLHNMELRLDDLVRAFCGDEHPKFALSPAEKYILLAAILFHDIGKASDPDNHGLASLELLIGKRADGKKAEDRSSEPPRGEPPPAEKPDSGNWAEYGIPTIELAQIIAKLAQHHDPKEDEEAQPPLSERSVDPYGRIREKSLAAVLILLDEMDTSHLRVVSEDFGQGPKGFRTLIQGVEIDAEARLIRTVLADSGVPSAPSTGGVQTLACQYLGRDFDSCFPGCDARRRLVRRIASGKAAKANLVSLRDRDLDELRGLICGSLPTDPLPLWDRVDKLDASARKLLKSIERVALDPGEEAFVRLALIQRDLQGHRRKIEDQQGDLSAIGIALDDWVLEYQEHLFDEQGRECWESPIFDTSYLQNVAQQMWNLSVRVFGTSWFSYETLGAAMREADTKRIKRAVRRLRILTEHMSAMNWACKQDRASKATDELAYEGALEANDETWRWSGRRADGRCSCVHVDEVIKRLKELHEQRAGG